MNAEQKKRIAHEISNWRNAAQGGVEEFKSTGERMADLLQELVDAPEPEPVARVTGYYGGYLSIATVDGRVLPAGTALYLAPPAPSVPDGWRELFRRLYVELFHCDKQMTNTLNDDGEPAWQTGKTVRAVLDDAKAALDGAPTPAEAPEDVARDAGRYRWLRRENAKPGLGFYVGNDTDTMPGDITWIGSDLDAAIDAAMREKGGA